VLLSQGVFLAEWDGLNQNNAAQVQAIKDAEPAAAALTLRESAPPKGTIRFRRLLCALDDSI
jgi:hypothetical protein